MVQHKLQDSMRTNSNWEKILTRPPYSLKVSRDNGYVMLKYNQLASDFSLQIVREARGIIFYEETLECVCRAFDKFGNYGEPYVKDLDWENGVSVQEKIDGSLCKVFYHNGEWRIATNGTIDAYKAELGDVFVKNFGQLFEIALNKSSLLPVRKFTEKLQKNYTYMFEVTSPANRVVVPYEDYGLTYLGQRNMLTLEEEYHREEFSYLNLPKIFDLKNLEDVVGASQSLPWDEEGYVCVDSHYNRCKIKSPAYVQAHYARANGNVTERMLVDVILKNETDEFLIYASDHKDDLEKTIEKMDNLKQRNIAAFFEVIGRGSPREFASRVFATDKKSSGFIFFAANAEKLWAEYTKDWTAAKWLRELENAVQ